VDKLESAGNNGLNGGYEALHLNTRGGGS
jgi:hypothetical protein